LGLIQALETRKAVKPSGFFGQIPYSTEQGIIFEEQGIFSTITGKFHPRNRESLLAGVGLNEDYPGAVETTNESGRIKY
jgi:hypothetical protein